MRTIFLEFYGMPGCGKSTVSHIVAQKLKDSGMRVAEPSYDLDHDVLPVIRKLKKLFLGIVFAVKYPVKFVKIKHLVRENGYCRKNGELSQILNIIQKVYQTLRYNKVCDYVIFDEGFCQAAVSLTVNSDTDCNDNISEMVKIVSGNLELRAVYIREDIETVLKRMKCRHTRDSRVEKEKSVDKRILQLRKIENICEHINLLENMILFGKDKPVSVKSDEVINWLGRIY